MSTAVLKVSALAVVAIAIGPVSASQARAKHPPCKVTASTPVHLGPAGGGVRGVGTFVCRSAQKHAGFAVTLQTLKSSRWVTYLAAESSYGKVATGKTYTLPRNAICAPGAYRTRAVLKVGKRSVHAVSASSHITCSGGPPVSCDVEPQPPSMTSGGVVGTGTITCNQTTNLAMDLRLEVFNQGQWTLVGEYSCGGSGCPAPTPEGGMEKWSFTTNPFPCGAGAPSEQFHTILRGSTIAGDVTKTSPIVNFNC